ncbi:hypothetical protein FJZ31_00190 [Candidatus Poribacteria bacterium]|nr:hypothetical protein [Candidatus Poribacteria bacterium]
MQVLSIDEIAKQTRNFSEYECLKLIKLIIERLEKEKQQKKTGTFIYGKYANIRGRMSTEEDFKIAEWFPSNDEV